MIARATLTVLALATTTACSIFNAPDDKYLDGGPDSGMHDGRVPDAGTDAGPQLRETVCNDDVDNDADRLTDCRDFDCAGHTGCCSTIDPMSETTPWMRPTPGWTVVPSADMPAWPRTSGGTIESFGISSDPRAVVRDRCVPMLSGMELTTDLTLAGECPSGTECYAAIVLSSANDMAPGSGLLDELAVRLVVTEDGVPELRATRNGEALATHTMGIPRDVGIPINIRVGPTVDAGRTAVSATVTATLSSDMDGGTGVVTLLDDHVFMPQAELISDMPDCTVSPGLFIAVEGVGDNVVRVGPLTRTEGQCANPTRFDLPGEENAILTRDRMTAGFAALGLGDWASGGISHPALVSTDGDWHVFVDATDVERTQDLGFRDLGFAIGHANAVAGGWNAAWTSLGDVPKLGDCHPSCVDPATCASMCPARRGYREPSIVPLAGPTFIVAYARENVGVEGRPFGIDIDIWNSSAEVAGDTTPDHTIAPGDVECHSLREPSLVPAGSAGWWLFFTCERDGMAPGVHAIRLSETLAPMLDTHIEVLPGVRSPEALVEPDGTTAYFRLWAATGTAAARSFVLYTGEAPVGELPMTFTPYPDNPVLTRDDIACPGTSCEILAMSVARDANRTDTLRYLVAWQVDSTAGTEYQLVPLEQIWPP